MSEFSLFFQSPSIFSYMITASVEEKTFCEKANLDQLVLQFVKTNNRMRKYMDKKK